MNNTVLYIVIAIVVLIALYLLWMLLPMGAAPSEERAGPTGADQEDVIGDAAPPPPPPPPAPPSIDGEGNPEGNE